MSIKQARVITVTGVKGGVGKTTTTLNIAGILANKKLKRSNNKIIYAYFI